MEELLKQTQAYLNYIKEHYECVQKAWALIKEKCPDLWFIDDPAVKMTLDAQVLEHDMSKLSEAEFVSYRRKFFPTERERHNPSDQVLSQVMFDQAWESHKANNLHHWQSWTAIKDPHAREQELHCIHMVVDWVGMALQRGNPLSQYYHQNKHQILIPLWAREYVAEIFERLEK